MIAFDKMTLEELTRPEGHACTCGKRHVCPLGYVKIGRGAIAHVAEMVRTLGKNRPFVVCDQNTYRVAGEQVCALLDAAGMDYVCYVIPGDRLAPAEWEVGSTVMHYDTGCDLVLAVGSGVVNDICKVVAHIAGVPSAVVGTAPSMDGYASNTSAMEMNNVKVSLYNRCPVGILLDSDILAQAPMRMLWAGVGDMMAKYLAICEWRIAHRIVDEYYCEQVAQLMRSATQRVMDAADGIARRDPDTITSVAEGLVIAGISMAYAGISRPASGLEHYFSHMWETMALERKRPYDLHGIQVGVGTILTLKLYEKLCRDETLPDKERALAHMRSFDPEAWEAQVRRIFGAAADEIIAIEGKTRKNDPEKHAQRVERLVAHWDDIVKTTAEELPEYRTLCALMEKIGMPVRPSDIDICVDDVVDAFIGARDIRDKYLICSLLWDLGAADEYAQYLREVAET